MRIDIDMGAGRTAEAYVARPEGGERAPGVLMFVDAIGLRPRIEDMADRIASWGYVVLAPHVFYRDGRADDLAPQGPLDTPEAREAYMGEAIRRVHALTPERSGPDTDAWLHTLTHLPGVSAPVGVVGYCMGARLATRAAADHPDLVAACAGFHGGRLATDAPDSPHLSLGSARATFFYGHSDHDRSMPPEAIATLERTFAEHGLQATQVVYPDAPHGYSMADTAVYDEQATERHFTDLRTLLDTTLRGGSPR